MIVRLYGKGRIVEPVDPAWDDLIGHFPDFPGVRSVVVVDVEDVKAFATQSRMLSSEPHEVAREAMLI